MAETKKEVHVDDFVGDYFNHEKYARWFLFLKRLPAALQADFSDWIGQYKLYCTYQDERYRVTGASRLGDVWLAKDHQREIGYDLRVNLAECTTWGREA